MGDVGAISYFYIVENTFFSMLLLFAWCYMSDSLFGVIRNTFWPLELTFVFLMYLPFIRFRWPVSSFRDSLNSSKGMSPANRRFFVISTYVVKGFYM